jgi:hypothetical protein
VVRLILIEASPFLVYGTVIEAEHYVKPNDLAAKFDKKHYYSHPEQYHSEFYQKVRLP